jgi:centrosomal protein CEP164
MRQAAAADGGTGSLEALSSTVAETDGNEAGSPEVADLYEYCLSLGIDADQDEDLVWVVHEAFNAPLPGTFAEYTNEEGRVYYFNEVTGQSSWEHPLDQVYREVLELVKRVKAEAPRAPESQKVDIVRDHLQQVHNRAVIGLEGWSGPYGSEQGEYYHNAVLQVSSWESPVVDWERELQIRHEVLCRCLLSDQLARGSMSGDGTSASGGAAGGLGRDLLPSLRLPLNLIRKDRISRDMPQTPSTTRSFYTARSSARSYGSSTRSKKHKHGVRSEEEKRLRQERRAARERRAQEAAALYTASSSDLSPMVQAHHAN